ncbi:hypothetical protein P3W85_18330 [Cupriavidus basilensis]|uniref:Uncharacterized protein n=1 Tax=Cupriavidus basilensis TaxID=68895 RepID=A0ABT6AQK2_9BURK|nr:hypothetical protein [Cupriavidus basilensis]MDF3834900.1 hypothetical protein [Cupriavidus basilensis]
MKTLAQPRTLAATLLCAIGLSMAAASAHAATPVSDLARLDGSIGRTVDAFTDGARNGPRDPYTDGARIGQRDVFSDGARGVNEPRSSFSDGA